MSPETSGQWTARNAYGCAGKGGSRKQRPGSNSRDSSVVLQCESVLTLDWSHVTITYEEAYIKEQANNERFIEFTKRFKERARLRAT